MSKLFCHKDLIMNPDAVRGKDYRVVDETDFDITIRNEHGELHSFSKYEDDESYFGHWFFHVKE